MPYEQQLAAAAQAPRHPAADIANARLHGRSDRRAGKFLRQHRRHVGTTSGTQAGTQIGNTTGSSTQTTSTPFNPLSLLPLAFLPMTGGAPLGGGILGSLGGGVFNSLSNGFMGPGAFNRG